VSRRRYLKHMREAIDDSRRQTDGGPVTLLAHSAGGWLARVYLLSFGTEGGCTGQQHAVLPARAMLLGTEDGRHTG